MNPGMQRAGLDAKSHWFRRSDMAGAKLPCLPKAKREERAHSLGVLRVTAKPMLARLALVRDFYFRPKIHARLFFPLRHERVIVITCVPAGRIKDGSAPRVGIIHMPQVEESPDIREISVGYNNTIFPVAVRTAK